MSTQIRRSLKDECLLSLRRQLLNNLDPCGTGNDDCYSLSFHIDSSVRPERRMANDSFEIKSLSFGDVSFRREPRPKKQILAGSSLSALTGNGLLIKLVVEIHSHHSGVENDILADVEFLSNTFSEIPYLSSGISHANATSNIISNAGFQKNDSRIDEQLSNPPASINLNLALNSIKSSDPAPVQTPKLFLHALRATIQIQKRHLSSDSSRIEMHFFSSAVRPRRVLFLAMLRADTGHRSLQQ